MVIDLGPVFLCLFILEISLAEIKFKRSFSQLPYFNQMLRLTKPEKLVNIDLATMLSKKSTNSSNLQ